MTARRCVMDLLAWTKLQEELLKAQLGVIRNYRRSEEPDDRERKNSETKRKSHMSMIIDILEEAKAPLHISEIISRAGERYAMTLDRESVVSALTKKVKKGRTFVRTGPNTFGLKDR
jgi:predicted transcriptional regulator